MFMVGAFGIFTFIFGKFTAGKFIFKFLILIIGRTPLFPLSLLLLLPTDELPGLGFADGLGVLLPTPPTDLLAGVFGVVPVVEEAAVGLGDEGVSPFAC